MDQEKVGKFIKDLRKKNGLTQKELADSLGVTYQAVSKWENGKSIPDIGMLKLISEKFNINIDDLLSGQKVLNKKNKWYIIGILLIIFFIIVEIIFHSISTGFEFKKIGTTCKEFMITGSAAYNSDKSSIYISNIDYCGKENNVVYDYISCNLYEEYNDSITKISSCDKKENVTLDEYLKNTTINVDNYSAMCVNFKKSNIYLEITAIDDNNITTTYKIPLTLNNNC